uniref:peptidylprolyl isomerase n=1 Tax=Macrostomum lignano TaxID=282301 RepID=A0A1I8FF93_9PLAT
NFMGPYGPNMHRPKKTDKSDDGSGKKTPEAPTIPSACRILPWTLRRDGGVMKTVQRMGRGDEDDIPGHEDRVSIHYVAVLLNGERDGEKVESTRDPGRQPLEFVAQQGQECGAGLHQAVKTEYAYSKRGCSTLDIPPKQHMLYEVELLSYRGEDISPEEDGSVLKSIMPRHGLPVSTHRLPASRVGQRRHRGDLFDSRILTFELGGIPEGVEQACQRMIPGEKARVVIEPSYSYGIDFDKFGVPKTDTVVYEVELLSYQKPPSILRSSTAEFHGKQPGPPGWPAELRASAYLKLRKFKSAIKQCDSELAGCLQAIEQAKRRERALCETIFRRGGLGGSGSRLAYRRRRTCPGELGGDGPQQSKTAAAAGAARQTRAKFFQLIFQDSGPAVVGLIGENVKTWRRVSLASWNRNWLASRSRQFERYGVNWQAVVQLGLGQHRLERLVRPAVSQQVDGFQAVCRLCCGHFHQPGPSTDRLGVECTKFTRSLCPQLLLDEDVQLVLDEPDARLHAGAASRFDAEWTPDRRSSAPRRFGAARGHLHVQNRAVLAQHSPSAFHRPSNRPFFDRLLIRPITAPAFSLPPVLPSRPASRFTTPYSVERHARPGPVEESSSSLHDAESLQPFAALHYSSRRFACFASTVATWRQQIPGLLGAPSNTLKTFSLECRASGRDAADLEVSFFSTMLALFVPGLTAPVSSQLPPRNLSVSELWQLYATTWNGTSLQRFSACRWRISREASDEELGEQGSAGNDHYKSGSAAARIAFQQCQLGSVGGQRDIIDFAVHPGQQPHGTIFISVSRADWASSAPSRESVEVPAEAQLSRNACARQARSSSGYLQPESDGSNRNELIPSVRRCFGIVDVVCSMSGISAAARPGRPRGLSRIFRLSAALDT